MDVLVGSGYYQFKPDCNETNWASWGYRIGGSSGAGYKNCFGGSGGTGGKGGTVTINNPEKITALNGKFKQNNEDNRQTDYTNECVIYAQIGFSLDEINSDFTTYHTDLPSYQTYKDGELEVAKVSDTLRYANDALGMISYLNSVNSGYRTINYDTFTKYGKIGIGSGAGFHEISNGTLTIEPTSN